MKRNAKSGDDGRENKRNQTYHTSCKGHGAFTKMCRKWVRARAKQALRNDEKPLPKDPKATEYFD